MHYNHDNPALSRILRLATCYVMRAVTHDNPAIRPLLRLATCYLMRAITMTIPLLDLSQDYNLSTCRHN